MKVPRLLLVFGTLVLGTVLATPARATDSNPCNSKYTYQMLDPNNPQDLTCRPACCAWNDPEANCCYRQGGA